MPVNPTNHALPGAEDVTASDSGAAVSEGEGSGVRDVLSRELNKDFPTDAAAIKAVKDTFAYVGSLGQYKKAVEAFKEKLGISDTATALKRMEELTAEPKASAVAPEADNSAKVKELESKIDEMSFYSENPDLKPYKSFIDEVRGNSGKPIADVVKSDAFKSILEKAKSADAAEKSKSVLQSNPRLGAATDKMTQAREALKQGDVTTAKKSAVSAVIDAYELGK